MVELQEPSRRKTKRRLWVALGVLAVVVVLFANARGAPTEGGEYSSVQPGTTCEEARIKFNASVAAVENFPDGSPEQTVHNRTIINYGDWIEDNC